MSPQPHAGPRRPDGERVRFCLSCGEMVPFAVHVCPACGHYEPGIGVGAGPTRACGACAGEVAASALYCPLCGEETGLSPAPRWGAAGEADVRRDRSAEGAGGAGVLVGMLALAGPIAVAAALVLVAGA